MPLPSAWVSRSPSEFTIEEIAREIADVMRGPGRRVEKPGHRCPVRIDTGPARFMREPNGREAGGREAPGSNPVRYHHLRLFCRERRTNHGR